jgi:hypothetical protein
MPTLLVNKTSNKPDKNGKIVTYGLKGDSVTIISVHDTTLIVENNFTKVRFSAKECDVKQ